MKKIRHVRREGEYLASLKRFYQINDDLANLAGQQTRPPEDHTRKQLMRLPNAYVFIRDYAAQLHQVFRERLQEAPACKCVTSHVVNLRLQRVSDERGRDTGILRFTVLFSFDLNAVTIGRLPWDWQDTRTRVEPEQKPEIGTDSFTVNSTPCGPGPDNSAKKEEDVQKNKSRGIRATIGSLLEKKPIIGRKRYGQKEE